tara:strand:+ start:1701 stop:2792 length:1092 start_codon:yes stop_codon:yes gene_type:complete
MKKLVILSVMLVLSLSSSMHAQGNDKLESIAVVSIDTRGLSLDNLALGNLVRLELEKTQKYEVLDKYDVANRLKDRNIDPNEAFGKSQLVSAGKQIGADFMLSGSAEKYGNKIIYILRLIDVQKDKIIKSDVKEYVFDEQYIQIMTRLSLASLLGLEANEEFAAKLKSVETPIVSDGQKVKLSGPRFGMQFYSGELANRLMAPESEGGYNSSPYATVFAYQHEFQYVSSGEFQVLLESILAINGIETSYVSPSLTLLNGFRYKGWDFGFGPVFRFSRVSEGYIDESGKWQLNTGNGEELNYDLFTTIDKRGDLNLSTGLLVAVGKNFRSGHINLPVNFYYSHVPSLDSHVFGFMLGFNIARSK